MNNRAVYRNSPQNSEQRVSHSVRRNRIINDSTKGEKKSLFTLRDSSPDKPLSQPILRKLRIGQENSAAEQHADKLANHALSQPLAQGASISNNFSFNDSARSANYHAPEIVHRTLSNQGRRLDQSSLTDMQSRFHYDFSKVKIHTDDIAARSANAVNALAYTVGHHIVFNQGQFNPHSHSGRQLLAHELAHVIQTHPQQSNKAKTQDKHKNQTSYASPRTGETTNYATQTSSANPVLLRQSIPNLQLNPNGATQNNRITQSDTQREIVLEGFETDSAALSDEHNIIIRYLADQLNANPLSLGGYITIWGYADSRGSDEHNRHLGQRRANAVMNRLRSLVTDPQTRSQIRAYSLGEELNEQDGDIPQLRRVEIRVTRRHLDLHIRDGLSTQPPLIPGSIQSGSLTFPATGISPNFGGQNTPGAPAPPLPFWFYQTIAPANRARVDLRAISTVLTGALRRELARETAGLAAQLAGVVGVNASQDEIRRSLDDAIISGGEAALTKLLETMIFLLAGEPTRPPPNIYGPPMEEFSAPGEQIFGAPSIPF